jgi:hypothetical protein
MKAEPLIGRKEKRRILSYRLISPGITCKIQSACFTE